MDKPIRVLVADDHTIVRSGVRLLLESEPDMMVVGEALDGMQALEMARTMDPDVVLMDLTMPKLDGMEATRRLKEEMPQIQVVALTMQRSDEYFFEMLEAGASGYVLKAAEPEQLVQAVRAAARGEVFLHPALTKRLLADYLPTLQRSQEDTPSLSPRETEIMHLLIDGYSNKEIAEKLVLSPSTIHTHRNNLMNKLGLHSRRDLIEYARAQGLLRRH